MKKLNQASIPCLLIIMSVLSQPALARDYSYMDDHTSDGTASSPTPAAPTTQNNSFLNSVIDALDKDSESITGKFYRNIKKDQNPQFRNRYEQDKYDRQYRERKERELDRYNREYRDRDRYNREKQYPGMRKGWSEEKWHKERDKQQYKAWKKEQKRRDKEKSKYYKKQKYTSDREWREIEYERRKEWEKDRREYIKERNGAYPKYRREYR